MKNIVVTISLLATLVSHAQPGWNWPEGEAMYKQAQEKQAYYKVLMGQDKYEMALVQLKWLYDNNANLNPSIYIDGVKCVETVMKSIEDKVRIAQLQDSALWMYDARIGYFGNEASVMDRKAHTAFKYHYKNPSRYPLLIELYDKALDLNGAGISNFNLTPPMLIAKYAYERKLEEMPREKVLDIHSTLSNIIDEKERAGKSMKDTRDKIDAFLSSIDGLISCDYIKNQLVPRLEENPDDLNTAKKIFSYSLQAKCSDQPYFMLAAETVGRFEPSYKLAEVLGNKWYNAKEYSKALAQFTTASALADKDQDAFEALMGQAKSAAKLGQKSKARSFARNALNKKPGAKEPYNLIGNLYFSSASECNEGKSRVLDRASYLAAYDMYKKAGNTAQMASSEGQFPSISEIFEEGYEEGQMIQTSCWISESVKLRRRP